MILLLCSPSFHKIHLGKLLHISKSIACFATQYIYIVFKAENQYLDNIFT